MKFLNKTNIENYCHRIHLEIGWGLCASTKCSGFPCTRERIGICVFFKRIFVIFVTFRMFVVPIRIAMQTLEKTFYYRDAATENL